MAERARLICMMGILIRAAGPLINFSPARSAPAAVFVFVWGAPGHPFFLRNQHFC
jgi:hypothetical protein